MAKDNRFTLTELAAPLDDWTGARIIIRADDCPGGVAAIIGGAEHYAGLIAAAPLMRDALEAIAGFAPGNGDVCEVIARRARAALATIKEAEVGSGE